jgi:hypothetical protein
MSQHERAYVVQALADSGELGLEQPPIARQAGVDDRDIGTVDDLA